MLNYFDGIADDGGIRQHPWNEGTAGARYYDFKCEPQLIPEVLEDFKRWDEHKSIQDFYRLVEWINGPGSRLESNDCRLRGPKANEQRGLCDKAILSSGGLMVLFRNLELGLSEDSAAWAAQQSDQADSPYFTRNKYIEWFSERSLQLIEASNPDFASACIAVHLYPTFFKEVPAKEEQKFGYQIAFEFWAWGDDEREALANFGIVVDTLFKCLNQISSEITK